LLEYFNVGIIGGLILIIISFILYLKIGLITRDDINDICRIFKKSNEATDLSRKIIATLEKCHLL